MQLAFYFDQTRCTGCRTCVVACKDWNDLPTGAVRFRRIDTHEEGRFPNVKVSHLSISCNHCRKPTCADACPENAIIKREDDGIVLIDGEKCTGCRVCASASPYEAISFLAEEVAVGQKCDFCMDRPENGEPPRYASPPVRCALLATAISMCFRVDPMSRHGSPMFPNGKRWDRLRL